MRTGFQQVREEQLLLFSSCAELSLLYGAHHFCGPIFTSLNLSQYQMWLSSPGFRSALLSSWFLCADSCFICPMLLTELCQSISVYSKRCYSYPRSSACSGDEPSFHSSAVPAAPILCTQVSLYLENIPESGCQAGLGLG